METKGLQLDEGSGDMLDKYPQLLFSHDDLVLFFSAVEVPQVFTFYQDERFLTTVENRAEGFALKYSLLNLNSTWDDHVAKSLFNV